MIPAICMKATNNAGDEWEGGRVVEDGKEWFMYLDRKGRLYESTEVPAYRIKMNNATQQIVNGKQTIVLAMLANGVRVGVEGRW